MRSGRNQSMALSTISLSPAGLDNHLGAGDWVVGYLLSGDWVKDLIVMSFRSEAFSLDFCHIKFWRGCLRFLLKRRQPFA